MEADRQVVSLPLKRRNFLFAAASAVAAYPLVLMGKSHGLKMLLPDTIPWRVSAAKMGPRANALRLDFVNTHMRPSPRKPLPLAKIFHGASMRPTDVKKAEKLFSREDLKWQGDRLVSNSADKFTAAFKTTLCSLPINMSITFPKVIDATVSYQSEILTFTFNRLNTDPILFTLGDLPQCEGETPSIGFQQILASLSVSQREVVITTSDKNNTTSKFELTFDLTKPVEAQNGRTNLFSTLFKRFTFLPMLLVCTLIMSLFSGCREPTGPRPPPGPNCPVPTTDTICFGKTPPDGFLVIDFDYDADSNCPSSGSVLQPNVSTVECYDDKDKGCPMEICVGQQIPEGWKPANILETGKSTRYSTVLCWVSGSAVDNVQRIERVSARPAVPKCGATPTPANRDSRLNRKN